MEVDAMTKIIDPERTIKSPEASKMWQELLIKKNQLKYVMEEIDGRILKLIAHKSISNPLQCLSYFVNMLANEYIEVTRTGSVIPTAKFMKCLKIDDWTALPVPRLAMKINMQALSQFFYSI